jgi:hypothetical protein
VVWGACPDVGRTASPHTSPRVRGRHGGARQPVTFLVGIRSTPMDIEEFYDGDPRRRPSAEIELGTEWHDSHGTRYEVNWVEDTGELYLMREPVPHIAEDPFGGLHFSMRAQEEAKMTVHVVAQIDTHDQLEKILNGWQQAMAGDGGAEWLADRLRTAGVAVAQVNP